MAGEGYPCDVSGGALLRFGWGPLWMAILDDLSRGAAREIAAARFHKGLISALSRVAGDLASRHGPRTVVLSGGVFQNRLLLEGVSRTLREAGLTVLTPRRVPANDGGIALGQAVIAAASTIARNEI
jgi:hydrogenase maturation protein HypF